MEYKNLNSGYKIPVLGLGTWKLDKSFVLETIKTSVEIGYRLFDGASAYGNEAELGEAYSYILNNKIVNREDIFITSKLWNDSHEPNDARYALKETLKNLRLDYLDLYLIHWPVSIKKGSGENLKDDDFIPMSDLALSETWTIMEEFVKEGLVKSIGVSNYSIKKLEEMKSYAQIMPCVNQVEMHPFLQQDRLLKYCNENNIIITAYSPLGSSDRELKKKRLFEPSLLENNVIKEIALEKNATPAQILIAWEINKGVVTIPKSTSKEHLIENFNAQYIKLTEKDLEKIKNLNKNFRYVTGREFESKINGYTCETIWDE